MKTVLFFLVLCSATLFGSEYKITQEKELSTLFETKISPYFYKHKLHFFTSFDGVKIAYKIFPASRAKGTVVISSGRTEGMIKYQELIYDLHQNGYNVYILDHRGQGYSQRLVDDKQMGYVDNFLDYVKDMRFFVAKILKKNKKMILLGHSMGGAIASLYAEIYPKDFDMLILSSPMHQPKLISSKMTNLLCSVIGKKDASSDHYMLTQKSYDTDEHSFENNLLTHSQVRYSLMLKSYEQEPQTKVGGASVQWISQACKGATMSVDLAEKIVIPTLLLQAQEDKIVVLESQERFCKKAAPHCQLIKVTGAYHELFIEKDTIRNGVLQKILDFIAKNGN